MQAPPPQHESLPSFCHLCPCESHCLNGTPLRLHGKWHTGSTQKVGKGALECIGTLGARFWSPWVLVARAYGCTLTLWFTDKSPVCDWLSSVPVTHKYPRCHGLWTSGYKSWGRGGRWSPGKLPGDKKSPRGGGGQARVYVTHSHKCF